MDPLDASVRIVRVYWAGEADHWYPSAKFVVAPATAQDLEEKWEDFGAISSVLAQKEMRALLGAIARLGPKTDVCPEVNEYCVDVESPTGRRWVPVKSSPEGIAAMGRMRDALPATKNEGLSDVVREMKEIAEWRRTRPDQDLFSWPVPTTWPRGE